jgi:Carbohydrate family 9 binding domain-like
MMIEISHIDADFVIDDLAHSSWQAATVTRITKYWTGEEAPRERHFSAKLLWSDRSLYVRFDADQEEPLAVNDAPDLKSKTMGLWERDVCEIFIAPDHSAPNRYYEFEVAPTGEWLDLAIEITPHERVTHWNYSSDLEAAAAINDGKVIMAINVPFSKLGPGPRAGDIWQGNLFRCVGRVPDRGYLTWQPTETVKPNFHVPERFGQLIFT